MSEPTNEDTQQRLTAYLQAELDRQRTVNAELRRAVADMARAFQETLARANDAAETGDIERVKRITFENRQAWQAYLAQIVAAASGKATEPQNVGTTEPQNVGTSGPQDPRTPELPER